MNGNKGVALNTLSTAAMVKEVDNNIGTLATILDEQKLCSGNDARVVREAYDVFGLLSSAFDTSPREVGQSVLLKDVSEVKQTGDGAVLENQNECDNTEDGSNKKGKGSNKGNKSKKSKGLLEDSSSSVHGGAVSSVYGVLTSGYDALRLVLERGLVCGPQDAGIRELRTTVLNEDIFQSIQRLSKAWFSSRCKSISCNWRSVGRACRRCGESAAL
ncbi:hypothetical protein Tco_0549264 [Tanacetum coccineum]